ncbi:winged helix-turn-helix transcriptional regulator [Tundrisphaera sp. TA3]|uniref:winged helix-turn-helix transcriptional regulator n=1 Tax=Tundrisphaera sp. TA3 TaxID=3435775 RepID=UPI003EBE78BD
MRKPVRFGCGIEAALAVVGGKWKVLVLWNLSQGRLRFGELRRRVAGINEKMLIQQLRELEADGVVSREDFREVPPRVEYAITPFGITLAEALRPLCEWGKTHTARIEATKSAPEADGPRPAIAPAISCGEPTM